MASWSPRSRWLCRSAPAVLGPLLALGCLAPPVQAEPGAHTVPRKVDIDWPAVAGDALALSPQLAASPERLEPRLRARAAGRLASYTVRDGMLPLALLNELVADVVPGAATVPVPVLAPLDAGRLVGERLAPEAIGRGWRPADQRRYLDSNIATFELVAGVTGYDAVVAYDPEALKALGIASTMRRMVHIAGAALSYGSAEPGELVADLQGQLPGLRRQRGEYEVAYTFRKYGAPYFAVVSCSDEPSAPYALPCAEAEVLLGAAVRSLRLIGGSPLAVRARAASADPARPRRLSRTFTYYPPGRLLEGSGDDGMAGAADYGIYGDIRFPIGRAPSYAQSQVFMHWGNCVSTPGTTDRMVPLPPQPGDAHARYHCIQNDKPLLYWEGHPENYAYPWRDNFCESRRRAAGSTLECPAGRGHQGQDIRPRSCPGAAGSETCRPDVHTVVAAAAGKACRDGNKVRLRFDATTLYYVYLHMNTGTMDAAGIPDLRCTAVRAGRVIGKVGNFDGVTGGTSTHLHFEIHPVDPYSRFNPYMTLVRAYERLIGARGTEITAQQTKATAD